MLADVWPFNPENMRELNLACWCPVDHQPPPPGVLSFLSNSDAIPIAMSRFGEEQLADHDPLYVPHMVDTSVYKPGESKTKTESFPAGSFVVGMCAANKGRPSRKGFSQAIQAVAKLAEKHDNIWLYLHSVLDANHGGGEHLLQLAEAVGFPSERIVAADQYRLQYHPYKPSEMQKIYGVMDVLLNPAFGEGFGVPQIEAQACGIPVIATDFTAMREVVGAGWHVKHTRYWSGLGSWQAIPDVDDIHSALEECYSLPKAQREKLSKAARRHAMRYDVQRVWKQHWLPTLNELERRFAKRSLVAVPDKRQWSVSIVTPWQDHPEFAADYEKAILAGEPDELLIVDDGSENPIDEAAYRFERPAGFVACANKGLELATGDVVVFLNNDIELVDAKWLDRLLAAVEPGVIVGEVRNELHAQVDGRPVPYVDGWCFAAMRSDLELLYGFDSSFEEPAYFADNDLCVRAVAAGMKLRHVRVGLRHILGGSTDRDKPRRDAVTIVNRQRYERRVRDLQRLLEPAAA